MYSNISTLASISKVEFRYLVLDHTSLPGHHYDRCAAGVACCHDRGHLLRPEPVEKGGNILYLTSTDQYLRKAKTGIENSRLFRNQAL